VIGRKSRGAEAFGGPGASHRSAPVGRRATRCAARRPTKTA